jgi:hypothetical protein
MAAKPSKLMLLPLAFSMFFFSGCCGFNWDSLVASLSKPEIEILPEPMMNQRVSNDARVSGRRLQRVLMIATGISNGSYETQQKLIAELANQFRQRQMFEVVAPRHIRLSAHSNNIVQGKFNEAEIAKMARDYNADAIAIVTVNEFKSSAPMRIGLSVAFVDSAETVVLAASDSMWDLGKPVVRQHFDRFVENSFSASEIERPLLHHSPQTVLRFVAANVTQELIQSGL